MNASSGLFSEAKYQRILLVVLVASVYGISLLNGFVWDDNIYFIGNSVYKDFNLRAMFFSLANGVEYLPLRDITYALDYLVWGENPLGFHLTNLLFFTTNTLLAFRLAELITCRLASLRNSGPSQFTPLVAAALFTIHPINAEAANFVTCRNVLVSGLFFFCACIWFIQYLENPSKKNYYPVVIFFICALLGKATAIMLPALLLLTMPPLFPGRFRKIALSLYPLFAIAAVFFVMFKKIAENARFIDKSALQFNLGSIEHKVAVASQIPFFYFKKFLFPYGFSIDYIVDFSTALFTAKVLTALAGSLLLTFIALVYRRKFPEFILAYFWFMAALIPVLNFFATNPLLADRYAYLPVFGLSVGVATAFDRIATVRLKLICAALLCLLLASVSFTRSLDWRTPESLWKANIKNLPDHTKSYLNLAAYYFDRGDHQQAINLLTVNPNVPWIDVYRNYFIGCDNLLDRNYAAAKEAFQRSLVVLDGFIGALYCLGSIAEVEGDYLAAVNYYNRALASRNPDFLFQLPIIKVRLQDIHSKRVEPYIVSLKQKIAANPADTATIRELALTLDQLGLYKDALEQYLQLRKMGIQSGKLSQNIANCYLKTVRSSDAIRYYEEAIALDGGDLNVFNNLGLAYRNVKQYAKSAEAFKMALQKFPDAPYPALNLGITYYAAGRKEEALNSFTHVSKRFPEFKDRAAPYLKELSN